MFVKKLVEKASNKLDGNSEKLSYEEIKPRLIFHYGIPSRSTMLAYDSIQKILAISKDGQIKLLGRDNAQALLESDETVASKYLQFIDNKGILLNVNLSNHIEVWDVDKKVLSFVHTFKKEITSFATVQCYLYVGDTHGNISVLKLDQYSCQIVPMEYSIPLSASHGNTSQIGSDTAVTHILPQPKAETKRVLFVFRNGSIILWGIQESKAIFMAGGNVLSALNTEVKSVSAACWACPFGSKVTIGYSNGDIFIWSISPTSNSKCESAIDRELCGTQSSPICKLNLGYKIGKIPIQLLKWGYVDGKASRLYIMGSADYESSNLLQIILLNHNSESLTSKLILNPPDTCIDMEIISSSGEQSKHKQDLLLLLGKSGHIYMYDDSLIEKYLLRSQSRSSLSIPREVIVRLPFTDSSITVAKFITDNSYFLNSTLKECDMLLKNVEPLIPFDMKPNEGTHSYFGGLSQIKNLYITGHSNGSIQFWDISCQFLLPVSTLKQQSADDFSLSDVALTVLDFDKNSLVFVSGDQNGMVRIYKFKPEVYVTKSSFMSIPGNIKNGNNLIKSLKVMKVNGAVLSLKMNHSSKQLAVGSSLGYVSVIDLEAHNMIYEKHFPSVLCAGIIYVQFKTCNFHGFEKNAILVGTGDSSMFALDADTGNMLNINTIHPKKPSKALLVQVLNDHEIMDVGSNITNGLDVDKRISIEESLRNRSLLLLCSEKATYIYSLTHLVQGVKKVHYKKTLHSPCLWASTFYSNSGAAGLILLFASGKFEIRSLPELSLLKESSIRGFTFHNSMKNPLSNISICSSKDGELVLVNNDQEIFFMSVLRQNEIYRNLDSISEVYKKDLKVLPEGNAAASHGERKKGLLGYVIKDIRGNKAKNGPEMESENPEDSIKELSKIFSIANFPLDENKDELALKEDGSDLNIDDIDLEEKPKAQSVKGEFSKQKILSKFKTFKGKLKQMTENEKGAKEEKQDKAGAVDQIKMKYGFPMSGGESKMAGNKLGENLVKLQGLSMKTTEMQDTAKSFSLMAKKALRYVEHK